jgi:hypothetical protein
MAGSVKEGLLNLSKVSHLFLGSIGRTTQTRMAATMKTRKRNNGMQGRSGQAVEPLRKKKRMNQVVRKRKVPERGQRKVARIQRPKKEASKKQRNASKPKLPKSSLEDITRKGGEEAREDAAEKRKAPLRPTDPNKYDSDESDSEKEMLGQEKTVVDNGTEEKETELGGTRKKGEWRVCVQTNESKKPDSLIAFLQTSSRSC